MIARFRCGNGMSGRDDNIRRRRGKGRAGCVEGRRKT